MGKAQVNSQVFVYILTFIITAALLIFGYNSVNNTIKNTKKMEMANFKTRIQSDFNEISSDYSSVKTKTYTVPSDISEVCFYQEGEIYDFRPMPFSYPLIDDSIRDTENNVFLVNNDGLIDAMDFGNIKIINEDYNIICIKPQEKKLNLRLEGIGDSVLVKQA